MQRSMFVHNGHMNTVFPQANYCPRNSQKVMFRKKICQAPLKPLITENIS